MAKAASSDDLARGFREHERQTRAQVKRLERIVKSLDESPRGRKCVGREGLLEEGAELIQEKPEPDVLDAGLIAAAQHVEIWHSSYLGKSSGLGRPRRPARPDVSRREANR